MVDYLNQAETIKFEKFESRFKHYMTLSSVRNCGSPVSCNLKDLEKSLAENLAKFDFFKKTSKPKLQDFVKLIALKVRGEDEEPWEISFHKREKRPARSFRKEKDIQILKQLASQLYYRFISLEKTHVSEVQVLHAFDSNKTRYLFFAANQLEEEKNFQAIKNEWEVHNLQGLVTKEYNPFARNEDEREELAKLSKRHAEKLKQRVFSSRKANGLIHFIQNNNTTGKFFVSQFGPLPDEGIYFVNPFNHKSKHKCKRHAEEQLSDIAQFIRNNAGNIEWRFAIFGKMRPCGSCYGRLCYEKEKNNDLIFSLHPGFLWISALMAQDKDSQISTIKNFILSGSNVSEVSNLSKKNSISITSIGTISTSSFESDSDDMDSHNESKDSDTENKGIEDISSSIKEITTLSHNLTEMLKEV